MTRITPRSALRLGVGVLLVLVTLAVATYVAGERTEVAVLRTFDADGATLGTRGEP